MWRGVLLLAGILLVAPSAPADQDDPRLDALFAKLQELDPRRIDHAGDIQARIWYLWYQHDSEKVNAAMEAGLKALSRDRHAEAVEAFSRATRLDPDFAEAWNRRGTAYYVMGRYQKSLADTERVLELEPRHFAALAGRGLCLRELGRPQEAIDAFQRALEINPHLQNVYLEILRVRARMDAGD